jgi:solute carrier family 25 (mitochondrial thiamine pyrophosphate transporter), member 19
MTDTDDGNQQQNNNNNNNNISTTTHIHNSITIDKRSSSNNTKNVPSLANLPKTSYPQWHNTIAGAVAGASARLATAPLDLIRIRAQLERGIVTYPRPNLLQKLRTIYQQEGGFLALFRGSVAATYLWIGYSMVQFSVYAQIKQQLTQVQQQQQQQIEIEQQHLPTTSDLHDGDDHNATVTTRQLHCWLTPTMIAFLSGAGAGVCATVSTYPFDICRTVFAAQGLTINTSSTASTTAAATAATFQPPKSLLECATRMYYQKTQLPNGQGGGISAFFVGVRPAVVQIIPYMGLNFAIYDALTQDDRRIGLSGYAGSVSGAVSKMIVYPCDTIKKRIQYQSVFGPSSEMVTAAAAAAGVGKYSHNYYYYTGMWDCLVTMIRTEGITSLYRGLVPSVLKTTIGSGLSFTFFRMTKNALEEIHDYQTSSGSSSSSSSNSSNHARKNDRNYGVT